MHTRSVKGYTLIEVLVAVLVLAVGVIGAAGVQLAALRTRHGTALMSGGVQLGGALAERMRANSASMHGADSANPYLQLRYDAATDGAPVAGAMCFAPATCSSADMAAFDLYEVKQALYDDYPNGRVAVCRDATVWAGGRLGWDCAGAANAPIVIKLGWRDRRADLRAPVAPSVALVVAGAFP